VIFDRANKRIGFVSKRSDLIESAPYEESHKTFWIFIAIGGGAAGLTLIVLVAFGLLYRHRKRKTKEYYSLITEGSNSPIINSLLDQEDYDGSEDDLLLKK
jgi:hypothetical protein